MVRFKWAYAKAKFGLTNTWKIVYHLETLSLQQQKKIFRLTNLKKRVAEKEMVWHRDRGIRLTAILCFCEFSAKVSLLLVRADNTGHNTVTWHKTIIKMQ